ncbi:hypothetical protein ABZS66_12295 [Dactylosporangium sp. NPDC005572]|uniref:hypothetical protein n=1 Tax=Dactylosporangium sp. NPDC005572 TaxID=3156889 RepID=UPI00339E1C99
MNDVFIIGAGFSKAISHHMPVTGDLGDNEAVRRFLQDHDEYRRLKINGVPDLEAILTLMAEDQPWLTASENRHKDGDFIDFVHTVNTTVRDMQVDAIEESRPRLDEWLLPLARRWSLDRSTIVTFNYDTMIEKAVTAAHEDHYRSTWVDGSGVLRESDLAWAHSAIYAAPIPRMDGAWLGPELSHPTDLPELIKLHGSLNWYYSGTHSVDGPIRDIGVKPFWQSSLKDRKKAEMKGDAAGKSALIIPPTYGKKQFLVNDTIRGLWEMTGEKLKTADRIFLIGYSIPPGDHMVRSMLVHNTSAATGHKLEVVVVNPDEQVANRVEELFDLTPKWHENTDIWAAEYAASA